MKKAWRTTLCDVTSIVAAETRGQAIAITVRSAREANYTLGVHWTACRAVRAPEHDAWAEVDATRACWSEQYLPATANK